MSGLEISMGRTVSSLRREPPRKSFFVENLRARLEPVDIGGGAIAGVGGSGVGRGCRVNSFELVGRTFSRAILKTGRRSSLRRVIWSVMRFISYSRTMILESTSHIKGWKEEYLALVIA